MTAHSPSNHASPDDPFGSMEVDPTEPEDTHMGEASDPTVTQFTPGTLRPKKMTVEAQGLTLAAPHQAWEEVFQPHFEKWHSKLVAGEPHAPD